MRISFLSIVSLIALCANCATAPDSTSPKTVPEEGTEADEQPAESLAYPDDWILRDRILAMFQMRVKQTTGYDGEFGVRELDGVEVQRLVDERGRGAIPRQLLGLVGRADARFVLLEIEEHPHAPYGMVFFVPPESGLPEPILKGLQPMGTAFYLGLEPLEDIPHPDLPEFETSSGEPVSIPVAAIGEVKSKIDAGEDFMLLVTSDGCGNSDALQATLTNLSWVEQSRDSIVDLPVAENPEVQAFADTLVPELGYPTAIAFRGGEVVDWNVGNEPHLIRHLFFRNGLADGDNPPWVYDATAPPEHQDRRIRALSQGEDLAARKFDGADLSGGRYRNNSFAGSSLRDVDLSDSDLRNANFAHADLTGADLSNTDLVGTNWYGATCPDRTKAEDNGGRCEVAGER